MDKVPNSEGVRRCLFTRLAWLPIPLLLMAMAVFWAADLQGTHESTYLLLTLNLVFSTPVCLLIAYLAARSFLVSGALGLLLLGCGVVIWAPAGVVATAAAHGDANVSITIYNSCVWLSSLCHLAGVSLSLRPRRSLSPAALWLPVGYALAAGAVVLVTLATLAGWIPAFFVEGQGGTPVRQLVLMSAMIMFALTASLLSATSRKPLSDFAYWYALALTLLVTGLAGVLLQTYHASALGWTGRATQSLGGLYMLIAAVASVREARVWGISLQAALRESQALVRAVVDGSPDLIYMKDLAGRVLMANPAACEVLGRPARDVLGRSAREFHRADPEVGRAILENDRRVMESGRTETIEERGLKGRIYLSTKAPYRGADGSIVGLIGISHDITERKRVEEALRELNATLESKVAERTAEGERERQRLYAVLEALPAMTCLLTPDYHVAFANRSFREKFGEAHGRRCHEFCFGHAQPCAFCETYQVLKTGRPHRWELTGPDGRTIIDAYDFPFTDVDGSPLILEMAIDITTAKRTEAALKELNEALAQRAKQLQKLTLELAQAEDRERRRIATILHEDLQQQIAGAKFHLSLLSRRGGHNSQQAVVEKIDEMLKEAIEKSRRLSHELSPAVLHLNDLAEALQWLARRMQAEHGLTVRVEIAGEACLPSEALTMFLFRAAQEMLLNVIKHAQVSEATIRVRRRGRYLCLIVTDEGRGFDPRELKETPGFGLLGIRERVELLGGRMTIKSANGKGSRFHIVVPHGGVLTKPESASH